MGLFVLVGFGLILSHFKYGTWTGLAVAFIVVSMNIQVGLFMQKFWFNVFINGFNNDALGSAVTTGN